MYKDFYHYFYDQQVEEGETKNLEVLNVTPINQRYDAYSILTSLEFITNLISLRLTSIPYNEKWPQCGLQLNLPVVVLWVSSSQNAKTGK